MKPASPLIFLSHLFPFHFFSLFLSFILFLSFGLFFSFNSYGQFAWHKVSEELIFTDPPFKECHASTIVEVSPGKLMTACFGGTREGKKDVTIWLSEQKKAKQKKGKWTQPFCIADGVITDDQKKSMTGSYRDSLRFPCWNPVLFRDKEGKLFLFYKIGPKPREWWGMVRTSSDNGRTWSMPERLPEGVLGPIKNKPVQLKDGTLLSPSSVETKDTWKVYIERSSDLGRTWEIIPVDSNAGVKAIQPSILIYPDNRLQILCRSDQDRILEAWSSDNGKTWGNLSKLDLPNPNSGIDAVSLQNGWQLLVYNPTIGGKEWFNSRGKLNVAVSKDGRQWKDIAILEDGEKEEFSYPAVIQATDGKVHITYTFDRKNIKHVVLEEN
ncbi:sialidase family protein [Flavitalea flava]